MEPNKGHKCILIFREFEYSFPYSELLPWQSLELLQQVWCEVGDVVPGMAVEALLQTLLVQVLACVRGCAYVHVRACALIKIIMVKRAVKNLLWVAGQPKVIWHVGKH